MTAFVLLLGAFFAGLLKVGFGQGSGLLSLPLCTLVVAPRFANGVLAPLVVLSDFISIPAYWRRWKTRLMLIFLPGQLAGAVLGGYALARLSEAAARRAIGALLLVVVVMQVWARRSSAQAETSDGNPQSMPEVGLTGAVIVSLAAGFTSSLAQLGSIFLSVYLIRVRTEKATLVPTLNLTFLFSNLAKIAVYWRYGLVNRATWIADAWLAPVLLLGGLAGLAANRRVSQRAFENAVLAFALAAGAKLLLF